MASGPLGRYTFLYTINTYGVKNALIKKVEIVNNLRKQLQLLAIFAKRSIVDV